MKPLKLTHTRRALESLDRFITAYNAAWDTLDINNKRALILLAAYEGAENVVRRAFYEDTKDRNCLDNCMIVGINWLRELVSKEVIKIRPGLYRIGIFLIENTPNPEYEKSKPWRVTDDSDVIPNPIGRTTTLTEAIKMCERMS